MSPFCCIEQEEERLHIITVGGFVEELEGERERVERRVTFLPSLSV